MKVTKKKTVKKKTKISENKNNETPSIINLIGDSVLKETVILVNQLGIEINYSPKTKNPLEIEEHFKEELGNYLNDEYKDIYERVYELIKSGYDGKVWVFKLMSIPLKIRIFLSTGNKKDFNNVTHRLNEIIKEIVIFEKKKQEKDATKELREKAKEQAIKIKEEIKNK